MKTTVGLCLTVAMLLSASMALGQNGGGGGHGRNRGDDSSQRKGKTEAFLRRMDSNGNGVIDAEEVAGDQKAFVEKIFSRAGIQPKYPMPISQILEAMTNSDRNRGGDGSSSSGSPPPSWNKPTSGDASRAQPTPGSGPAKASQPSVPGPGPSNGASTPAVATPTTSSAPSTSSPQAVSPDPAQSTNTGEKTAAAAELKPASGQKIVRKSWRALTPRERSAGLPEWFVQKDADGDGQVAMAEYAKDCTPAQAAEFDRLDLNHDGVITAAECSRGEKRSSRNSKAEPTPTSSDKDPPN